MVERGEGRKGRGQGLTRPLSRRRLLKAGGAAALMPLLPGPLHAVEPGRSHGLAVIGGLKYPEGFRNFDYVDPAAPKGGRIVTQVATWAYNQNPSTFDTLNMFVLKGAAASGMDLTFATLMTSASDEPGSVYGFVAEAVEVSDDRRRLRFFLRPEARFHDGSPLTADDYVFSFDTLKAQGHPNLRTELADAVSAVADDDRTITVTLSPEAPPSLPLLVASLPIFSRAWWAGRDFAASLSEPPLGSGPYRVGTFAFGRSIEYERVEDFWGAGLPVMTGRYNFDRVRIEYYRDRTASFEAFKKGVVTFREEFTSRVWARDYNFPALLEGKVIRDEVEDGSPSGAQAWLFNTRLSKFADPLVREALGWAFDFEWTNKNLMFDSYKRAPSFFVNSPLMAEGMPSADERALLEPFRGMVSDEVFGEPVVPPVSDGSGRDRRLLQAASEQLAAAGCTQGPSGLLAPDGTPLTIEFLDDDSTFEPHHNGFIRGLRLLGVEATYRVVDPSQYTERLKGFEFEMTVQRLSMSLYPDRSIRQLFGSTAASQPGSRNLSGIADPVVDALIEIVAGAEDWDSFVTASRALDRVLRAGHYWIPHWYKATHWFAFWDMFSRPAKKPPYDRAVIDTWWFDADKAARIGRAE